MRKICKVLIAYICVGVLSINVMAKDDNIKKEQDIQYLEDGSYFVTEIVGCDKARTIKKGQKHLSYYNKSNKLMWKLTVIGTFSYNGSSSTCREASCKVTNIDKAWELISKTASKAGSSAIGKATMHIKGGGNTTRSVKLTCSKNGKLS